MARKYRVTVNGKAYDVDVEEMGAGVPAAAPAPAAAPVVAAPVAAVEEESADYGELIAVITAAIAASEGNSDHTGTDGFVVRSIRRRR